MSDDKEHVCKPRLMKQWQAAEKTIGELREERDALKRELDHEASAHLVTIDDRDSAQDALQKAHIALGGDGEWITRLPEPEPPESGDLCKDVPVIAKQIFDEAIASQERAERAESALAKARKMLWHQIYRNHEYTEVCGGCQGAKLEAEP